MIRVIEFPENSGVVGTGFSHEWENSIRKATERNSIPFVEVFMMLQNGKEISYETIDTPYGETLTKYTIKELDMFITVNHRGNCVQYGSGKNIVTVNLGKK